MTPAEFKTKWAKVSAKESAAYGWPADLTGENLQFQSPDLTSRHFAAYHSSPMKPTGANSDSGPPDDAHDERPGHLPRLPREYYQGDAVVHWTLPTFGRAKGWLTDAFHARFREWRFCGAVVPGYPKLHPLEPDFLAKFWKLYGRVLHPDAGNIKRPRF